LGWTASHLSKKSITLTAGNVLTKEAAFRKIQKKTRLKPEEILVVGDRPAREIRAGRELGMHTVRLRHGEFKAQMPTKPEEEPDYVIKNISQVRKAAVYLGAMTEWLSFFLACSMPLIDVPCQHFQGMGPLPRIQSWNSWISNFSPSSFRAFSRNARISSLPIL